MPRRGRGVRRTAGARHGDTPYRSPGWMLRLRARMPVEALGRCLGTYAAGHERRDQPPRTDTLVCPSWAVARRLSWSCRGRMSRPAGATVPGTENGLLGLFRGAGRAEVAGYQGRRRSPCSRMPRLGVVDGMTYGAVIVRRLGVQSVSRAPQPRRRSRRQGHRCHHRPARHAGCTIASARSRSSYPARAWRAEPVRVLTVAGGRGGPVRLGLAVPCRLVPWRGAGSTRGRWSATAVRLRG